MKITIEFDDTKDDLKAECFEAIRIMNVAKTTIFRELRELSRPARVGRSDGFGKNEFFELSRPFADRFPASRPARVGPPYVISSWVKEIDGDSAIRNVCVFEINL